MRFAGGRSDIVLVERTSFVLRFGDIERTSFVLRFEELNKVTEHKYCVSCVLMIHL
jgi:hypothetical protein